MDRWVLGKRDLSDGWAKPHPPGLEYDQMARDMINQFLLEKKTPQQTQNLRGHHVIGYAQHYNAWILLRGIIANVCKTHVTG